MELADEVALAIERLRTHERALARLSIRGKRELASDADGFLGDTGAIETRRLILLLFSAVSRLEGWREGVQDAMGRAKEREG